MFISIFFSSPFIVIDFQVKPFQVCIYFSDLTSDFLSCFFTMFFKPLNQFLHCHSRICHSGIVIDSMMPLYSCFFCNCIPSLSFAAYFFCLHMCNEYRDSSFPGLSLTFFPIPLNVCSAPTDHQIFPEENNHSMIHCLSGKCLSYCCGQLYPDMRLRP